MNKIVEKVDRSRLWLLGTVVLAAAREPCLTPYDDGRRSPPPPVEKDGPGGPGDGGHGGHGG